MTIIDENTPWPSLFSGVIYDAYTRWMMEKGAAPRSLIVPLARRHEFIDKLMKEYLFVHTPAHYSGQRFMGMEVLWAMDGGIRFA